MNRGEFPHLPEFGAADFAFIELDDAEAIRDRVKKLVTTEIESRYGLNPLLDIQVITPMNRGPLGVATLNQDLQAALNPKGEEIILGGRQLRAEDRVMQTRNNYDKEVYNGDLGWISRIDREDQQLWVRFDHWEIGYDWRELDELSRAYATLSSATHGGFLGLGLFRDHPDAIHPNQRDDPRSQSLALCISTRIVLEQARARDLLELGGQLLGRYGSLLEQFLIVWRT